MIHDNVLRQTNGIGILAGAGSAVIGSTVETSQFGSQGNDGIRTGNGSVVLETSRA